MAEPRASVSHFLLGAKPALSSAPGPRVDVVMGSAASPGRSLKTGRRACLCVRARVLAPVYEEKRVGQDVPSG